MCLAHQKRTIHSLLVQRRKDEVRRRMVVAARAEFAQRGFAGAILQQVAATAETSIGNLYKYFPNKQALFEAAIPPSLLGELESKLIARFETLGGRDPEALKTTDAYWRACAESDAFVAAHREAVCFLLLRAGGSDYADFRPRMARLMARLAQKHRRIATPKERLSALEQRALRRIYESFLDTLGACLEQESSRPKLRAAIELHTAYHLAGLRQLLVASAPSSAASRRKVGRGHHG